MTLNNLVGINLEKIRIDLEFAIKRLATAAKRNISRCQDYSYQRRKSF